MSLPSLDALLAEGSLAGRAGDFDHAIACFRTVLKRNPQHVGAMVYLSKACGLSFRYPEAKQWLQRALRLAPQNERVLQMAASNYLEWDQPEGALPLLRRAAEHHARSINAWVQLGRTLERANQVAEAGEAATQAAALSPRHPEVLWLLGRLAQRAGDFSTAQARLREALEQNPEPQVAAEIGYALASACDAAGDFDQAWAAACQAKELQRAESANLCEPTEAWHAEVERFPELKKILETEQAAAAQTQVTILCGYPRSGTTLLGQILAGHPQVIYGDEVLAVARVLRLGENLTDPARADWFLHTNAQQRIALRREYQRCLEAQFDRRLDWSRPGLIDKNPAVTRCLPALLSVLPGVKALYPLRDPRDVAISCYLRPFPVNAFTAHFNRLETLVAHFQANYEVWKAACAGLPLGHLEVRYEDLITSPVETNRAMCEFLGLAPAALPADHRAAAARRFIHSPTYAEVLQPLHQRAVGRWQAYAAHLGPQLDSLHKLAREQGYN
jgi:Flp pilus assembly protein TadD